MQREIIHLTLCVRARQETEREETAEGRKRERARWSGEREAKEKEIS